MTQSKLTKWEKFSLILCLLALLGAGLSYVARLFLVHDDGSERPVVAVIGSSTAGAEADLTKALLAGAEVYAKRLDDVLEQRLVRVTVISQDDGGDPARAKAIAQDLAANPNVVAVLGHGSEAAAKVAAPIYQAAGLPFITLEQGVGSGALGIRLPIDDQARFLANYARNISQQPLMYGVSDGSEEGEKIVEAFKSVYARFGTEVKQIWNIRPGSASDLAEVRQAIEKDVLLGGVFIAAGPQTAAEIIAAVRAANPRLALFGIDTLATRPFLDHLAAVAADADPSALADDIIVTTPLLFDTGNEKAQSFQTAFAKYAGGTPGWASGLAYDVTVAVHRAVTRAGREYSELDANQRRARVREVVSRLVDGTGVDGAVGTLRVNDKGLDVPVQVGIYDGVQLISAGVQLMPIPKGAVDNYISALREGKVLYVNDRFMYRTNVVYTGVQINSVSDIDLDTEEATIEASVWFRHKGPFDPSQVMALNAVEPINLETPIEKSQIGDLTYQRFKIAGRVRLNHLEARRRFGEHEVGLSLRHSDLSRNNLLLVTDVLGMPSGQGMVEDLENRRVLPANGGYRIDRAWVSQEVQKANVEGDPQYIGYSGFPPFFSRIDTGVVLASSMPKPADFLETDQMVYLAIFGVLGVIFARLLDLKKWGSYWNMQSWIMRLIFLPMLLVAAGSLALDFSFTNLDQPVTRILEKSYQSLWWLLGGYLLDLALQRFVLDPLETKSGRRIPNVVRIFTSIIVFSFAAAAITAFVFNETLTSLLATSGLMAMIIGLAVQANIANVFSGIVLNIERPFQVGDFITVNNMTGLVIDITWRTTRIQLYENGPIVSIANSKASEADIQNLSKAKVTRVDMNVHLPPDVEPAFIERLLNEAAFKTEFCVINEEMDILPESQFRGIQNVGESWVAVFVVRVYSKPGRFRKAEHSFWNQAYTVLKSHGVQTIPFEGARRSKSITNKDVPVGQAV